MKTLEIQLISVWYCDIQIIKVQQNMKKVILSQGSDQIIECFSFLAILHTVHVHLKICNEFSLTLMDYFFTEKMELISYN